MEKFTEPTNASQVFCPNLDCKARGQVGRGNIVIHGRKPTEVIVQVVTRLAYGCPVQAIVQAFGLDERTVASWRDRAGQHCEEVHHALVEQGRLDLVHVRACTQAVRALLVCTDGWAAYPASIRRAFRQKVKTTAGRGRANLQVWPELQIGTVIKHTLKRHVTHITRQMAQGTWEQAMTLLATSRGGKVLNTAFIERFNGTMRERLAALTRKCRHAAHRLNALHTGMYLVGCPYNFCWPHQGLSRCAPDAQTGKRTWVACTPAMASGLTDHVWSLVELMSYRVAPPPWIAPKRRGRKRTRPLTDPTAPKRPRGRPRKVVASATTS